jgi:hypothetical protein
MSEQPRADRTAFCVTTDIVASREIDDRASTQKKIAALLSNINAAHSDAIVVPFTITLGDEWQGLVANMEYALTIDFELRRSLRPLRVASGIGFGAIATALRARSAEMDGECFHRSRAALERAQQRKGSSAVVDTGYVDFDEPANALLLLLHAISEQWTDKQHETFVAYRRHGTESAAAAALGVSQPTVHQSLAGAMAKPYAEALDALIAFARRFEPSSHGANES